MSPKKFVSENLVLVTGITLPVLLMGFLLIAIGVLAVKINNKYIKAP